MYGDDSSTRAVVAALDQHGLDDLLRNFRHGGTWGTFLPGERADYLETLKQDLVALASEVEARLAQMYSQREPTDLG